MRNTNEVVEEAQREGTTDHFATLVDLCHFKKSELYKKSASARRISW